MQVFHEGCGRPIELVHCLSIHRPGWHRLGPHAVLPFPHRFTHWPPPFLVASVWEGADFCVAPIVEKFHVPCASLIRSTLGRCKLSELISTDLLSKGSSLNRDVQFLLCHERCRVNEFRIVSNRQVLSLQP